jgi:uncharacterized membrane protein HdeD (DUF308 family)
MLRATPAPWWVVLGQGTAFLAAAMVLLTQPGADHLLTLLALLAVCWLAGAGLDLVDLWRDRRAWAWKLLSALAGIGAGVLVLRQPLWSTLLVPATLLGWLGAFAVAVGALGLVRAAAGGGRGLAALGCLNLVMGVLLIAGSPSLVVWAGTAWAAIGGIGVLVAGVRLRPARSARPAGDRELAG